MAVDYSSASLVWKLGRSVAVASDSSPHCTTEAPIGSDEVRIVGPNGTVATYLPTGTAALPKTVVPTEVFGANPPLAMERTAGTFDVTGDGAAQYRVPLWVPPGRNGVQPDLSLVYSSRGGDGLLGLGWRLSGLSVISPCRRNFAQDNQAAAVSYSSDDALCLDGERLVAVASANGQPTEYRTERNIVAKIVPVGAGPSGPDYFKVYRKDGRVQWYGWNTATTHSRLDGKRLKYTASDTDTNPPTATTTNVTSAWYVAREQDRAGNAIDFRYSQAPESTQESAHEIWPETITYTDLYDGDTLTATGTRMVRFVVDDSRPDINVGFVSGFKASIGKRLSRIEVSGPSPTTAALLRSYEFTYQWSVSGRSQLEHLSECDAQHVCKRPTSFIWENQDQDYTDIPTGITSMVDPGAC